MTSNNKLISSVVAAMQDCADLNKVAPADLQWNDFQTFLSENAEEFDIVWGDAFKHKLKKLGGFRNIKDAHFIPDVLLENTQVAAKAKENRVVAKAKVVEQVFNDTFFNLLNSTFSSKNIALGTKIPKVVKSHEKTERKHHLLLSDLHFGADLDSRTGVSSYGVNEEARSLAQVIKQAIEFKYDYHEVTELNVNINGDIIQGKLHDPQSAAKMAEQVARAIWLLYWGIYRLSTEGKFKKITVRCTSGNHDRDTSRHHNRATNDKWDSEGTKIYYALKMACAQLSNVTVEIPMTPFFIYDSFGDYYYGTHGDTMINPGNPGSNVNINSLENQINRLNASLTKERAYKVVFLGHVHAGMILKLANGVTLITNPPLIPSDEYAQSIGYWESNTGQWLWESVKGHPVGDSRFLKVDKEVRNDRSLDSFIPPWQGF